MSTIDQQFVEYIVKTLVNNPDKVSIDRTIDEKGVLLSLEVDPEDVGRIIGKRGEIRNKLCRSSPCRYVQKTVFHIICSAEYPGRCRAGCFGYCF